MSVCHLGVYVEERGWIPLCHIFYPDIEDAQPRWRKELDKVTCVKCKETRSMTQMLICVCTHKEHGHDNNIGKCSRCDCKSFIEREIHDN